MTVTASGPMSLPFVGLAELIAACPTFQAAVGVDTAGEALPFVLYPQCNQDDPQNPPPLNMGILKDGDECSWEMSASLGQRGSLKLTFSFEATADYPATSPEALLIFLNTVGAICTEALRRANTPKGDGSNYWNLINFIRLIAADLFDGRKKTLTDNTVVDANWFEITLIAEYL